MNILFMSISRVWDITDRNIYPDLLRRFTRNGDFVYILSPLERRFGGETDIIEQDHCRIVRVKTLNQQKTNFLEKGAGILLIEAQYRRALKKYFSGVKFDLVLYATPPITLVSPIRYIKRRDGAFAYLLLKDIFPQNSVDIHVLSKSGIKGLIYSYFRRKEKKLYAVSDKIGCMSPANVQYLLENNPEIPASKVEECPNSIEVQDDLTVQSMGEDVRREYGIPVDRKVFLYGGNLGKPQCVPFVLNFISECNNPQAYFVIVGDGTEYGLVESFIENNKPDNLKLMKRLSPEDFTSLASAADVGLIFLDHRFTIPNFPSRLLGYMQAGIPILALTDKCTDVGKTIKEGNFGWWYESNDSTKATEIIDSVCAADLPEKGANAKEYLLTHYTVDTTVEIIENSYSEWNNNKNGTDKKK